MFALVASAAVIGFVLLVSRWDVPTRPGPVNTLAGARDPRAAFLAGPGERPHRLGGIADRRDTGGARPARRPRCSRGPGGGRADERRRQTGPRRRRGAPRGACSPYLPPRSEHSP